MHRVSDLVCSGLLQWGPEPQAGKVGPRSWIDVQCWARQGIRVGPFFPPPPIHILRQEPTLSHPHKKNLLRFGNLIGRLKRKKLDSDVQCWARPRIWVGPFSHPHPFTSSGKSPHCLSTIKKTCSGVGIPFGRLKRKNLNSEVGSMYNAGRGRGFGLVPFPTPTHSPPQARAQTVSVP